MAHGGLILASRTIGARRALAKVIVPTWSRHVHVRGFTKYTRITYCVLHVAAPPPLVLSCRAHLAWYAYSIRCASAISIPICVGGAFRARSTDCVGGSTAPTGLICPPTAGRAGRANPVGCGRAGARLILTISTDSAGCADRVRNRVTAPCLVLTSGAGIARSACSVRVPLRAPAWHRLIHVGATYRALDTV